MCMKWCEKVSNTNVSKKVYLISCPSLIVSKVYQKFSKGNHKLPVLLNSS